MTEPQSFNLRDVLYGLIVPILVAVIILLFPTIIGPTLNEWFPADSPNYFIPQIFTHGFAQMLIFGIPVILGLIWNRWAGGAAGFLLGTLYYCAFAAFNIFDTFIKYGIWSNLFEDPSFIGNYIVCGILIGYIAGRLNNKSFKFMRMLGSALTAAITVGIMQFILNYTVSFGAWMTQQDPLFALFTVMLPMVILGIITPIVAKFMWLYGLIPGGYS